MHILPSLRQFMRSCDCLQKMQYREFLNQIAWSCDSQLFMLNKITLRAY